LGNNWLLPQHRATNALAPPHDCAGRYIFDSAGLLQTQVLQPVFFSLQPKAPVAAMNAAAQCVQDSRNL
jgi:hypothetical protein